jgi:hypothetical protein
LRRIGKLNLKRIEALDDNFIPKNKRFMAFEHVIEVLADMFLTSSRNLDSHHVISDYRWAEFNNRMGPYLDFYAS